ncbi:MAG: hypothetical protein ACI90V_002183, partial [Bacillariaceae sp.]
IIDNALKMKENIKHHQSSIITSILQTSADW